MNLSPQAKMSMASSATMTVRICLVPPPPLLWTVYLFFCQNQIPLNSVSVPHQRGISGKSFPVFLLQASILNIDNSVSPPSLPRFGDDDDYTYYTLGICTLGLLLLTSLVL